jgi:hypothetical protein
VYWLLFLYNICTLATVQVFSFLVTTGELILVNCQVVIYSPARTASQQGSGKVGRWKINFLSTQKYASRSAFFIPFFVFELIISKASSLSGRLP